MATKGKAQKDKTPEDAPLVAYKGFTADWKCANSFQFEIGKTYVHDGRVKLCSSGFHACENPLDVWSYYRPGDSQFALVELDGATDERQDDTKRVGKSITLKASLSIADLVKASVEYIFKGAEKSEGYYANAATTGEGANAATTGEGANAATTGYRANAATTGYRANAATTGYRANAATTGEGANAATTGYYANAATTGEGANAATTGYYANAATTGEGANAATTGEGANAATTGEGANAATTGYRANAATTGKNTIAAALGQASTAKAGENGVVIVAWWDESAERPRVTVGYVGQDGVEAGVEYRCDDAGRLIKVDA